jgi:hypothetical protein
LVTVVRLDLLDRFIARSADRNESDEKYGSSGNQQSGGHDGPRGGDSILGDIPLIRPCIPEQLRADRGALAAIRILFPGEANRLPHLAVEATSEPNHVPRLPDARDIKAGDERLS